MGMMQEFKEFAVKGNAMDLAVGLILVFLMILCMACATAVLMRV